MQKTAYEVHISDWSSDVCSSDLLLGQEGEDLVQARRGDLDFVYASNPPILDQRLAAGIKREGETRDTMRRCRDDRAAGGEAFGDLRDLRRERQIPNAAGPADQKHPDRKSTRLNSSH